MAGVTSSQSSYPAPSATPPSNAVWIIATVVAALIALGAVGWVAMLNGHVKRIEKDLKDTRAVVADLAAQAKASQAKAAAAANPAQSTRRRRPPATTTAPTTAPAPKPG